MKNTLRFIVTAALPAVLLLTGCAVSGDAVVVRERHRPRLPAARVEVVTVAPHPGRRWVEGHWAHRGRQWVWVPGVWVYR